MKTTLEALYATRTYGGCLEGVPASGEAIKVARKQPMNFGGQRATLVRDAYTGDDRLPAWLYMALLIGPARSSEYDGTELVVIWFSTRPPRHAVGRSDGERRRVEQERGGFPILTENRNE